MDGWSFMTFGNTDSTYIMPDIVYSLGLLVFNTKWRV